MQGTTAAGDFEAAPPGDAGTKAAQKKEDDSGGKYEQEEGTVSPLPGPS